MTAKHRTIVIVLVSLSFGVMLSIIKGNSAGIRDAIGNISAPWLLLPFLASVFAKRHGLVQAASVGFLASMCALLGFYFANSLVLDLGPHPWLVDLSLTLRGMWFWSLPSLLSGPFFGLLGAWYIRHRALVPALLVALSFVFEPLSWKIRNFWVFNSYPIISVLESTVGIIACIVVVIRFKVSERH